MKRLLQIALLLAVLAWCAPANAWTCAQGATGCTVTTTRVCTTSTTSCNITVTSTHAGAVESLCEQVASTTVTISSTSDGGFTANTGSHGTDASGLGGECAYNLNATGSVTTITCTFSAGVAGNQCIFFEFTGTGSSFTFDKSALIDNSVNCTSCAGANLGTLGTSNNYILIQSLTCAGTCNGTIDQGFTAACNTGSCMAYKINVTTGGTTPNWTSTSAKSAGGAIALYEVTASTFRTQVGGFVVGP